MQFQQHFSVRHTYADDIESLFYAFVWIIIRYNGPLGRERPDSTTFTYDRSILSAWTEQALDNLGCALDLKIAFLVDPTASLLRHEISPYFVDLFDLADNWRRLHGKAYYMDVSVGFNEVAAVLDEFIATMPDDKKSKPLPYSSRRIRPPSLRLILHGGLFRPMVRCL